MSFSLLASTSVIGPLDGGTSASVDTSGANLLVAGANAFNPTSISDSKGNTWVGLTAQTDGVDGFTTARIWHVGNSPTVGSGHTFTYSAPGNFPAPSVFIGAFSGLLAGAVFGDGQNGSANFSGTATSLTLPNTTTTVNGDLIIVDIALGDPSTPATGSTCSGFTSLAGIDASWTGGDHIGGNAFYAVQGTAGVIAPTITWTTAIQDFAAVLACYKPAAGGGFTNTGGTLLTMGVG